MSLLDDIEKELGEISPIEWKYFYEGSGDYLVISADGEDVASLSRPDAHFMSTGPGSVINETNAKFIAAAPERIKLLVDFARATMAVCLELERLSGFDFKDARYATEVERNFIAARKALKMEGT